MNRKYILGNWKMNGSTEVAVELAAKIMAHDMAQATEVVIFPPFTSLSAVSECLKKSQVKLGGQDCSTESDGAFTGDISANMLKTLGCGYVIVGHSERRANHGETDAQVRRKAEKALEAGLIPVICVGESFEQREAGDYLAIIRSQLENSRPIQVNPTVLIAYEPVWAIGSGKTPTLTQIQEVHKTIATVLSYATSGARPPIVYGGSVKASNAREILSGEGIDGVLVGGASLKAEEFCAIIAAAH